MPSALFVFTFERITFGIYPVWDEFIDIEERGNCPAGILIETAVGKIE